MLYYLLLKLNFTNRMVLWNSFAKAYLCSIYNYNQLTVLLLVICWLKLECGSKNFTARKVYHFAIISSFTWQTASKKIPSFFYITVIEEVVAKCMSYQLGFFTYPHPFKRYYNDVYLGYKISYF